MFAASNSWRRPWLELIKPIGWFSRPKTFRSAMRRIKYNLNYFRANYTMVALFIFFLSLLLHREAVFFFTLFMFVLFLFYFIVDYPFESEVWNQPTDGRLLLEVLSTLPLLALLHAGLWLNVLVSFLVSFGLLGLHATFRGMLFEDLEPVIALAAAAT